MTEMDYDPEYQKMSMWDQLGKILDSEGNKIEKHSVITDDGVVIENITLDDAQQIKTLLLLIDKPAERKKYFDKIQSSPGFKTILKYVRSEQNVFKSFN